MGHLGAYWGGGRPQAARGQAAGAHLRVHHDREASLPTPQGTKKKKNWIWAHGRGWGLIETYLEKLKVGPFSFSRQSHSLFLHSAFQVLTTYE